jgi:hypothetical protein
MRLIDRDSLKHQIIETYEYEFPTASGAFDEFVTKIIPNIINNAPTIDAVPVVRCKDCAHYNTAGCSVGFGWCESMDRGVSDDFYCAYGAKKEDKQ